MWQQKYGDAPLEMKVDISGNVLKIRDAISLVRRDNRQGRAVEKREKKLSDGIALSLS